MVRFSFVLSRLKVNLWGVTLTHGSTGLSRPCNLIDDLLQAYREMSAMVPAITLFHRVGTSRGGWGMARSTRIMVPSKYRPNMVLVNSKARLLSISDTISIASAEANSALEVAVICRPFDFLWINAVIFGAFCLKL